MSFEKNIFRMMIGVHGNSPQLIFCIAQDIEQLHLTFL